MGERIDTHFHALRIDMDDQLEAKLLRHCVPKLVHLAKLPRGVDVKQWK